VSPPRERFSAAPRWITARLDFRRLDSVFGAVSRRGCGQPKLSNPAHLAPVCRFAGGLCVGRSSRPRPAPESVFFVGVGSGRRNGPRFMGLQKRVARLAPSRFSRPPPPWARETEPAHCALSCKCAFGRCRAIDRGTALHEGPPCRSTLEETKRGGNLQSGSVNFRIQLQRPGADSVSAEIAARGP